MQQTCAAETFRRRPKEHDRIGGPRQLAFRVAKSTMQFKNRFSILPNGDRRAQLAKAREVFLEKPGKPVAKFFGGKVHGQDASVTAGHLLSSSPPRATPSVACQEFRDGTNPVCSNHMTACSALRSGSLFARSRKE